MSASTALATFMDGAINTFLENPSVECAQLIVCMANTIRENTNTTLVVPTQEIDTEDKEVEDQLETRLETGHVMNEGPVPSGIGCAWIPNEQERYSEYSQCPCVRAGKIQLVVSETPEALCREHSSGEWCPCPGNQKKWIYRHFTTLNVTYFEQNASKVVVDVWNIARKMSDKDGWVSYANVRDYFSLEDYDTFQSQCKAFFILRDEWKILVPSDIPENSSWFFQLKPEFR